MNAGPWIAGAVLVLVAATAAGGAVARRGDDHPTPLAADVDLDRYMGDWYVIAHIPLKAEREAHDALESYKRREDGAIATTFTFRKGSFDAPVETMTPVGFVKPDTGNAVWGMRLVWPLRMEYRIAWLDEAYSQVIVARNARDHAWVMARTPTIPDADYAAHVERLRTMGYDVGKLRKVPQRGR